MTSKSSRRGSNPASALFLFALTATLVVAAGSNDSVIAAASSASNVMAHVGVVKSVSVPSHKVHPDNTLITPNPYLSFLPEGSTPDHAIWRKKMRAEAVSRRAEKKILAASQGISPLALIPVGETEPSGTKGANDTVATAENIPSFGTGNGDDFEADVTGELKGPSVPTEFTPNAEDEGDINKSSPTGLVSDSAKFAVATIGDGPFGSDPLTVINLAEFVEDDGDINKAGDTMVMLNEQVNVDAELGNGPHGSSGTGNGDFDFYAVTISDGQLIQATVTRQPGETTFDSILGLYDPAGNLIASNDDINANLESGMNITINTGGPDVTLYFAVASWWGNFDLADDFLTDPFDSSTGPGVETEGLYTFSVTLPNPTPGDFDFYHFAAAEGDLITVEVDTEDHGGVLDPIVAVYDSAGNILFWNDDDPDPSEMSFDSFIQFNAPYADTFYFAVGGFNSQVAPVSPLSFLINPFDSSSGPGAGSEGDYDIIVSLNDNDLDFYSFDLEAGDILGVNLMGVDASVGIFASDETLLIASSGDLSGAYPFPSPLPGGGTASAAYIVNAPGTYAAAVGFGDGAYTYELRVFRPPQEASGDKQIIYLDFDGESVDTSKWGGPGPSVLSPLSSFLPGWGLTGADENAVIDAILAVVQQNLSTDILINGANPTFDIVIQNSRDHAPSFGDPNVSRIIIGGTIAESGIATIGIAQSIDVGNYNQEEDSFVLLDLLSAPIPDPNSMNSYPRDPSATIIDLIGIGVGNIAAHEAGHFFANWHTDNFSVDANIMDTGGNMAGTIGIGADFIFGTGDDIDVNFGLDVYEPTENFSGIEDTRNNIAFGLTTSLAADTVVPLLMRRTTDQKWFTYVLSGNNIADSGTLAMTRSADYSVVSRADFDGDGNPDVLLRDLIGGENGRWVLNTLDGTSILTEGFADLTRNSDWAIAAIKDFDGDERADVLLRNSVDGRWLLYLMDGQTVLNSGVLTMSEDLTDVMVGAGDFNSDGRCDLLLRRADGSWLMYLFDGLTVPVEGMPAMTTNLAFSVQVIADFDGDDRFDVLLRRDDGTWFMYTMNGAMIVSSGSPSMSKNTDFSHKASVDFDGDGRADVLLRRTDGKWFMYTMSGTAILDSGDVNMTKNLLFTIVSTRDFDGDGHADLLLRRTDGRWVLYTMDGPAILATSVPAMTRNEDWITYAP